MTRAFLLLFILSSFVKAYASEITLFSPEGNVKSIRQVTARFSTDMVPMGDPRDTVHPFVISCTDVKGAAIKIPESQSRWADSKNWALDFSQTLGAGIRCILVTKENLADLKEEKVKGKNRFAFSTSGPSVVNHYPSYQQIEPDQYFILELDGDVDEGSLTKNAYFEVQGMNEKIGVAMVTGSERASLLEANFGKRKKNEDNDQDRMIVLRALKRFPDSGKIVFHWTIGILSKSGLPVTESQDFKFNVVPPFTAQFSCERISDDKGCSPVANMHLYFSSLLNTDPKITKEIYLMVDGKKWFPNEISKGVESFGDVTFQGPFPEKKAMKLFLPSNLKDGMGRALVNSKEYPLSVRTDAYSPLVKFNGRFGIVEWTTNSSLPVSVRNVEKKLPFAQTETTGKAFNISSMDQAREVISLYEKTVNKDEYPMVENDQRNVPLLDSKKAHSFILPRPNGEEDFEVMGIPLKDPGFYIVEIKSPRLGEALTTTKKPMYVTTAALVTNLGVHFKEGVESSLVWVTQLNDAKPVSGASVSVRNCEGLELTKGVTDKDGILKVGALKETKKCAEYSPKYIFVKKDNDFSFMNSRWSQGIETWRYQVSLESSYERNRWGTLIAHTIFDRTLFKAGETVQMKHILRAHHQDGFSIPDPKFFPKRVFIREAGSGKIYELPTKFDPKTGIAINSFHLSADAALDNYEVFFSDKPLKKSKTNTDSEDGENAEFDWESRGTGIFQVSEFRLPLMAATVKIQGGLLVRTKDVKVDLSAHYTAGGPATRLGVKTRAMLTRSYFMPDFPGAEEYSFFSAPVKAGIVEKQTPDKEEEDVKVKMITLDDKGGSLLEIEDLKIGDLPKNLLVEMEYNDPSGEVKTTSGSKMIFPSSKIVGLRIDSWFGSSETTKVLGVVTDPDSHVLKGVSYSVEAFKSESFSHRKRLVGGFYAYDSKTERTSLGIVCSGKTGDDGRFECLPKNLPAGSIILQAKVSDDAGADSYARTSVDIFAKGEDNWWVPGDNDRIDILPAKKSFNPNEVAQFNVKTPFKDATALVTVEREGVLDQFVTHVGRDNPVINVPMKGVYAPNVFVSAMLVRGRVGEPKPDFLVDLAKPAMKMGLTEVKVGWDAHKLKIDVSTDKKRYYVRDNASVKIKVVSPDGKPLAKDTEVVLAVLDESLLQLKENESFDLLSHMMKPRSLSVQGSSNLNQVIGRRHFGLKAKAPGGGGGTMDGPRENFDPLIAFLPSLKVNANGEAEAKIKLNDSISSFRIVAIAHSGAGLFGMGKANIFTNKDIILYSGISPVARSGDQIQNIFTVRNTTEKMMKVQITAEVAGIDVKAPSFPEMELNPSEAKVMSLPVNVPAKLKELKYNISARDLLTGAHDELIIKEAVNPSVPAQVLQATLFQLDKKSSIPVKQPADAILGSGSVNVLASSSLVHGLGGVKSYMEDYPYSCLEQRTSKAIVLDDKKAMAKIIQDMPRFVDNDGLLKFFDFPNLCGSSFLNHYVLDILQENNYELPQPLQKNLLKGINNYLEGKLACHSWWASINKDSTYEQEKIILFETLSRYKNFNVKSLESINVTPNLWSTETLVNWQALLKREKGIPKQEERLKEAEGIIRARVNFQGATMNLQEVKGDIDWRLFTSDDQRALGVLGMMMNQDNIGDDSGRMARGVLARLHLGHWDTTMANAWGVTMMKKFSQKFEKEKVTGMTKISGEDVVSEINWNKNSLGEKKSLAWPADSSKKEVAFNFTQEGNGKPWINLQTSSAIPLKAPMSFGYKITKNLTPVTQKVSGKWSVGDVVNVELIVVANNDQSWAVLRDPIPSGASHLGTGLGGESAILNKGPQSDSKIADWPVDYEEKSLSAYTAYAGYLQAGTYKINYRYRINSAGTFKLPPTHTEAMYSPEVFGDIPNEEFTVVP
jgi:uncharacterized protein YfaS (alpha-2-macroglobulin family)